MITFHAYGFLIGLGVVAAIETAERFAKVQGAKHTIQENTLWDAAGWVLIPAFIGARLYHVIDLWKAYYSTDPFQAIALWNGGLALYGGVAGGVLGLWVYTRRKGLSLAFLLDLVAVGLPVGQAIGRLGNYINQELYGKPTQVLWSIYIDAAHRLSGYESFERFHPLFAYEAVWSLITVGVLYGLLFRRWGLCVGSGVYFAVYLLFYAVGRFFLEYLRIAPWSTVVVGVPITVAQTVSVVIVVGALLYIACSKMGTHERKETARH